MNTCDSDVMTKDEYEDCFDACDKIPCPECDVSWWRSDDLYVQEKADLPDDLDKNIDSGAQAQ